MLANIFIESLTEYNVHDSIQKAMEPGDNDNEWDINLTKLFLIMHRVLIQMSLNLISPFVGEWKMALIH